MMPEYKLLETIFLYKIIKTNINSLYLLIINTNIFYKKEYITPNNILLNGMSMEKINNLTKETLVQGGFTGNINFKIALKTNDYTKTPSVTKIYIEYKN